jgi:hypothetical protein
MYLAFRGVMLVRKYESPENGKQYYSFRDMKSDGLVKLCSEFVDLSNIPQMEILDIDAVVMPKTYKDDTSFWVENIQIAAHGKLSPLPTFGKTPQPTKE